MTPGLGTWKFRTTGLGLLPWPFLPTWPDSTGFYCLREMRLAPWEGRWTEGGGEAALRLPQN